MAKQIEIKFDGCKLDCVFNSMVERMEHCYCVDCKLGCYMYKEGEKTDVFEWMLKMKTKEKTSKEKIAEYPYSMHFKVIDTIGVPHTYCITPKHLETGHVYVDEWTIKEAELECGAKCGVKGCDLSYEEHKTALLVLCFQDEDLPDDLYHEMLQAYLMEIKDKCEADGCVGFAFMKASEPHKGEFDNGMG